MPNALELMVTLKNLFFVVGLKFSKPTASLLAWLVVSLLEGREARPFKLIGGLPDKKAKETKLQRLRRFLQKNLGSPYLLLRAFLLFLSPLLASLPIIEISIDRTDWEKRKNYVNILMVALVYKGRGIPLFWIVLDYRGASSFRLWKKVLTPVLRELRRLPVLSQKTIRVLGDREFASPKLAQWLKESFHAGFTLRLKRSEYLNLEAGKSEKLEKYLNRCQKGIIFLFRNVTVTKDSSFPVNVLIAWPEDEAEPILLMSDLTLSEPILQSYEHRFHIEPMFKDTKTNAFHLEQSRLTSPVRIGNLLIPIAVAIALSVLEGDTQEQNGNVKKPPKGKERIEGLFLLGLSEWAYQITRTSLYRFKKFIRRFFETIFKVPIPELQTDVGR